VGPPADVGVDPDEQALATIASRTTNGTVKRGRITNCLEIGVFGTRYIPRLSIVELLSVRPDRGAILDA
jgi:hypothetical protein